MRPGLISGIDIEDNLIDRCRQLAAGAGANTEFVKMEPAPLPVDDGNLDVIFSKDSIIHIAGKNVLAKAGLTDLAVSDRRSMMYNIDKSSA